MIVAMRGTCALLVCAAALAADLFGQAQAELEQARVAQSEAQQAMERGNPTEELLGQAQRHEEEAARLFADAYRQGGLTADRLRAYGAFLLERSTDLAIDVYTQAAAIDPAEPAGHLGRLEALFAVYPYREDELLPALSEAAAKLEGPVSQATLHALRGDLYWRKGMYDLAEQEWTQALTQDKDQQQARLGLAAVMFMDADVQEAVQSLRSVGEMTPSDQARAERYLSDALRVFRESGAAFADTADNHVAYASLVVSAMGTEALAEAVLPLERAVQLAPDNHVAWNFLGGLRRGAGDVQGAREAYQRSLMAHPDQPRTQSLLQELEGK